MLEALDRANLFLVPLDDHRRWYRYHHLFADVLQAHLLEERPDDVAGAASAGRRLVRRRGRDRRPPSATRWPPVTSSGPPTSSSCAVPALRRERREDASARWVDELPDDVVRRPPGARDRAASAALMASNDFDGVDERLRHVERAAGRARRRTWWSSTRPSCPRLPGAVEMYRAALALIGGDPAGTIAHADARRSTAPSPGTT